MTILAGESDPLITLSDRYCGAQALQSRSTDGQYCAAVLRRAIGGRCTSQCERIVDATIRPFAGDR